MPAETFSDAWRRVRLHAPGAPFGLCREWTQHAYEDLVKRRPWQFTRVHAQMLVPASRSITCTLTVGSVTAASAALFLSTDVGLQLKAGTQIYTIQSVETTNSCTLDLAFSGTAGAQTVTILGLYQTLPADFGAFLLVLDPAVQRIIPWWFTQEDLSRVDPMRTSTGTLQRCLVSRQLSTVPATVGQVQYEWWPGPTAARSVQYYYRRQAQRLLDTDSLLGVVTTRVLSTGALAYCAAWPGTTDQRNPYFNLPLHLKLRDEFEQECARLELRDDDQAQESWLGLPYHGWPAWDLTGGDTGTLRSTDATLSSYI